MQLKGEWSPSATYAAGDVVILEGNAYHLQKAAAAGTHPKNTLYWGRLDQNLENAVRLIMDAVALAAGAGSADVADLIVNNLTTTAKGKILDARQGKALKGMIDKLSARVEALEQKQ